METQTPRQTAEGALLRAVNVRKSYARGGWLARGRQNVEALRLVSLEIQAGSTLAVIGASGSGKSTLARCLGCLEKPDSGEIWFAGRNVTGLLEQELVPIRRQIQMMFQDPASSLNPRLSAVEIVSEPLLVAGFGTKQARRERALELLELVGLPASWGKRLPAEFSGGQRRRLAIARALALEPKVLILDEALAGLDLSIQAQISNLLRKLQAERSLTYVHISHDLSLVTRFADEVALLDKGRLVESAGMKAFFAHPQSPQARDLLAAALAFREY